MKKGFRNVFVAIALVAGISAIWVGTSNPLRQDPQKIMIRNGSTGEETVLEEESLVNMMESLKGVKTEVSGLHLWTSGYGYIISFQNNGYSDEITVYLPETIVSGFVRYKTDADLMKIIKEFAE
ncbi:hypothetical protein J3A84_12755 [Proteiniclasticum sp. SCR006]|uniref:Uncharacterized protein n=1 Tax=Proteiniclasticum aestuarii TaxID=2817862 RepID=A0A939KK66_9CLOT|nr:hypothetical protein [Proteiniclasticum aestuarii]MBO1265903.1 hypothetical protein [Proteiniclasticum aestuarii]